MAYRSRQRIPRPARGAFFTLPRGLLQWALLTGSLAAFLLAGVISGHSTFASKDDDTWKRGVSGRIRLAEYEFSRHQEIAPGQAPAAIQAPNRAHGFRTHATTHGIRLVPRRPDGVQWEWTLSLTGYGRGDAIDPVSSGAPFTKGNRLEHDRGAVDEWYLNTPAGLEQGFTLRVPPDGSFDREAVLRLELGGTLAPRLTPDGRSVHLLSPGGRRILRYGHLHVVDASGSVLPSRMELRTRSGTAGLHLLFDDAGAIYPVTVDPLVTSPSWIADGDKKDAFFGEAVATAGDVNGDGYSDIVVGAPRFDGGRPNEGRIFIYHGSASGPSLSPDWTADGDTRDVLFGTAVGTAGDVNGDGYADIIVGAPAFRVGPPGDGAAFVFHGSPTGLDQGGSRAAGSPSNADWSDGGGEGGAAFGTSAGPAGDVNGDGFSDVIVGAPTGGGGGGRAMVYHGSATGLSASPDWIAESSQAGSEFGASVLTAGDVDGDGFAEVIVGAPGFDNGEAGEGRAFVFHGSGSGLAGGTGATTADAAWSAESNEAGAGLGTAVSTAGDVNGDGFADVIVGAPRFDNTWIDEGRAFIFHGSPSGLTGAPSAVPVDADWKATGAQQDAHLGTSVGAAGDVNGDGLADVIIGAPDWDNGLVDIGLVLVFTGSHSGLDADGTRATGSPANAELAVEDDQAGARLGSAVGTAGDVDGDGYSDVLAGSPGYDDGQTDEGRARLFPGSDLGMAGTPDTSSFDAAVKYEGGVAGARMGSQISSAGDVNGDGFEDLIIAAPSYDNGEAEEGRAYVYYGSPTGPSLVADWIMESNQAGAHAGGAVASAGDVNGDGYDDILIGTRGYENGEAGEGALFVYHGSATGLDLNGARPSGTPLNADWSVEGDRAYLYLGADAASAGDVNGDGFADVIVGIHYYVNGQTSEGVALLYRGSASGLRGGPAATPATAEWKIEIETDSPYGLLGTSVARAGDVNGDGYDEILVGAPAFYAAGSDSGAAYLYLGRPGVPSTTADWSFIGADGERLGATISTAGDVNGDGFSDWMVGAPLAPQFGPDRGRVLVFHGSGSGLPADPAIILDQDLPGLYYLGRAIDGGRDINGDGFSDVVLGRRYNVFLFLGSPTGLASTAAWTALGDTESFGKAVALADLNGDGSAELIAGDPEAQFGPEDWEGFAYVFFGNERPGAGFAPRQRLLDDSAPVAHLGASDSQTEIRVAMEAHAPFGRGRVKLEVEARPIGVPFDGTGTVLSPAWTDTGTAGTTLGLAIGGFSADDPIHWRARLHHHPVDHPLASPRGRWLGPAGNGWEETDLRTASPPCPDGDADDFGTAFTPLCLGGTALDCDDADAATYPGAPPVCDGENNDCLDPAWPSLAGTNEQDDDLDGFSECQDDCDDGAPGTWPGAPQLCDGINTDCSDPGWPAPPLDEIDDDLDGFAECAGECNDADASVHPGAPEVNDGKDNQCPGDPGAGLVDELAGDLAFDPADHDRIEWSAQAGATSYLVARAGAPDFGTGCSTFLAASPSFTDPLGPVVGSALYYLAKPLTPNDGSWGADSAGVERSFICGSEAACTDGLDNDLDGFTDCDDPDCSGNISCQFEEFTFVDTSADDLTDAAISAFLGSISADPNDYFFLEFDTPEGILGLCSERADFYRDTYLALAPTTGVQSSGTWSKWYRDPDTGGAWAGPETAGYENYYGSSCSLPYSWCVELGLMPRFIQALDPATTGVCEALEVERLGCGTETWEVTLRVGRDRLGACGF